MRQNKSRDLLEYFIRHSDQVLTGKELSGRFGISERQVKNYIRHLNGETEPNHMIEAVSSNEYRLCENYRDYLHLFPKQEYLPKNRISIIISKLLLSDEPVDIFDLADELYVSRSTIESDLNRIKRMVSQFQLTLHTKNDFVSLDGGEKEKRKLTGYMINNEQYSDIMSTGNTKYLNEAYQSDFLKSSLMQIFDECYFTYNDYSLNNIILHLIITIDRLKRNYELTDVLPSNMVTAIEKKAAVRIASLIEENFDVKFTDSEMVNLALFLSCNLSTVDYNFVNSKNLGTYINAESVKLTCSIMEMMKEYYDIDEFDDIFITRFGLHISNLLKRLSNHYSVRNPITDELMLTYPLIYEIAVSAADTIHRETGYIIEKDEIALIALHIGSFLENNQKNKNKLSAVYVYSNYHNFYQYNIERIQKQFQDSLNIRYRILVDDYLNSNVEADIVISECSMPDQDITAVSPFVTEEELSVISAKMKAITKQKENKEFQESFAYMFHENLFFCDLTGADEFEVIRKILKKIEPLNYFQPSFTEDVLHREKLSSTCFHNGVAIPHSISQHVTRSFISFTCFEKGQVWNGETVYLVIAIGIAYRERKIFRYVFNQLIHIFTNKASVFSISKCKDYNDIVKIVEEQMR